MLRRSVHASVSWAYDARGVARVTKTINAVLPSSSPHFGLYKSTCMLVHDAENVLTAKCFKRHPMRKR